MAELKPFTVPSTGKVVNVRTAISPAMVVLDLITNDPDKPKAPVVEVVLAGKKTTERNYADPRYQAALEKWEQSIEQKAGLIMLETAVHINLTDADKKDVNELREKYPNLPLNQNDKMIWLKYIAIKSDDDLTALIGFIRNGAEPTEESVKETAEGFPR